ncbi:MAG TPA: glycosyltransferase family 1 protein [Candidatus Omnitrophota bacterium]|nr:glycosyltransferase family 1 protein [Candidatus Omnitrophota bacterium]
MKIGIDIQAVQGQVTGLGVYARCLSQAIQDLAPRNFEISFLLKGQGAHWNTFRRLWWENVERSKEVIRQEIELLHVPAFAPPLKKKCRVLATVPDIIGLIFPNQLGWPSRFYWGKWYPEMIRRADALIAISENTKKDVMARLGVSEKKIHVIYLSGHERFSRAVDAERFKRVKARFGIREQYFMTVGTIEPRKNIFRVVEAYTRFLKSKPGRRADYQLVLAGSKDFAHGRFFESLLGLGIDLSRVICTGYVAEEDLNCLYSGATAFVFPSLYEGFGIPVLEAMASGTPVLASRASSVPEVAGAAAYYIDPLSVDDIAEGMRVISEDLDLKRDLIRKGFEQIKKFSWQNMARQTLEVYERLV